MSSDLSWKPGPPPLDVPGRYDTDSCVKVTHANGTIELRGVRLLIEVADGVAFTDTLDLADNYADVRSHFGPIPSPPSGEQT